MRYRKLGRSQLMTSEVGFGAWAIGGGWGPIDDDMSVHAIRKAVDEGVSFIDTADVYGVGHSEEVIGQALEGNARHRAVIATKAGLKSPSGNDFSPSHIAEALEASLKRLNTDWVDILQLHNPTRAALADPEIWDTLRRLKAVGKIRAYGASVHSPLEALLAMQEGDVDTVEVVFNVIDQEARTLFETAKAADVGVIGRVPLASASSRASTRTHRFHRTDWRSRLGEPRRRQMLRRAQVLDLWSRAGLHTRQAALTFVLSYNALGSRSGARTPEQAGRTRRRRTSAAAGGVAAPPGTRLRRIGGKASGGRIWLAILVFGVLLVADPDRLQALLDRVRGLINWLAE
jgi:aryl-alcohol dehydrogenase-like predicted oxidoreductase